MVKYDRKTPHVRSCRRWDICFKIYNKRIDYEDVEWIQMAQDSVERKIKVDNESRREEKETKIKINKEI